MKHAIVAVVALLLGMTAVIVPYRLTRSDTPPSTVSSDSDLAARINAACGPGWKVDDWTVGSQFEPLPAGVVQVTCVPLHGTYGLRKVAVAR